MISNFSRKRNWKLNTRNIIFISRGTMSEDMKTYINTLDTIINDDSVPRNIRRSAGHMKKILSDEKEPSSNRVAKVIYELEHIGSDTNIPFHTRTIVWGLSSKLESIPH